MTRATLIDSSRKAIRPALAAGLAVAIAQFLALPFPIYAMISAVIVTDVSAAATRQLALPRFVGTLVGATLGAAIHPLFPHGPWGVAISILIAIFLCHIARMDKSAKLAGYVCGVVVLGQSDHPWSYALFRVTETTLGIATAVLVSLVPHLVPDSVEAIKQSV